MCDKIIRILAGNVGMETPLIVCKITATPTLLYGSECWALPERHSGNALPDSCVRIPADGAQTHSRYTGGTANG
jgi:hypothetical protein